ncbi:MAG: efflux RND transporter periplasmic adaptor subunit [Limisphaerales bacterium]
MATHSDPPPRFARTPWSLRGRARHWMPVILGLAAIQVPSGDVLGAESPTATRVTARSPARPAPGAPAEFETQGLTEAYFDATLSAPVAGILGKHFFKEGDSVEAGQVIVELDKRMEELEVARRQTVLENSAEVLRRTEELAARTRSVAQEELDKHRAEHRIAQAELDLAREQLRRRQITAPFPGVIADLFGLDPGEGCQPQTPIARLVDTRRCWLVLNLEAGRAHGLRVGQRLALRLESEIGPRNVEAEIRFVSPVADPASGLVRVKAVFDNAEAAIPAGITATVRLPTP